MNAPSLGEYLQGVIAFPITPFRRDATLTIDDEAFNAHIEFIAGSGVTAIVVAGGTGEFFSLDPDEVIHLTRLAARIAHGRILVITGVGRSVAEGRRLAPALLDAGADGMLLMPPYYATPDSEALVRYYEGIAAAVPSTGLIFYARDAARLEVTTLEALAKVPNIVAVKDGQGSVRDFLHSRSVIGDRFKWLAGAGDDLVGAYASAGAAGYTSSLACFDPKLSLELWELAHKGPWAALDSLLQTHVAPWYALRRKRRGYEVAVVKAAVEAYGGRAGPVRPPLANLEEQHLRDIQELAKQIGRLTD